MLPKVSRATFEGNENKGIDNMTLMSLFRKTASVVRDDGSLGLLRNWDEILVSRLDKQLEELAGVAISTGR